MNTRRKLFIDQGRTTLYRLLRYIGQYRCNAVCYIGRLLQRVSYDTCDSLLIRKKILLVSSVIVITIINVCFLLQADTDTDNFSPEIVHNNYMDIYKMNHIIT